MKVRGGRAFFLFNCPQLLLNARSPTPASMAGSHWDPTCHVGREGATRKQQEETSPALPLGLQGAAEPRTLPGGPSPPRPEGRGHSLVLLSQGPLLTLSPGAWQCWEGFGWDTGGVALHPCCMLAPTGGPSLSPRLVREHQGLWGPGSPKPAVGRGSHKGY